MREITVADIVREFTPGNRYSVVLTGTWGGVELVSNATLCTVTSVELGADGVRTYKMSVGDYHIYFEESEVRQALERGSSLSYNLGRLAKKMS